MTTLNINYSVSELIAELEKLSGDLPVLTSGYEVRFEKILKPEICKLQHVEDSPWYDGKFEAIEKNRNEDSF